MWGFECGFSFDINYGFLVYHIASTLRQQSSAEATACFGSYSVPGERPFNWRLIVNLHGGCSCNWKLLIYSEVEFFEGIVSQDAPAILS